MVIRLTTRNGVATVFIQDDALVVCEQRGTHRGATFEPAGKARWKTHRMSPDTLEAFRTHLEALGEQG